MSYRIPCAILVLCLATLACNLPSTAATPTSTETATTPTETFTPLITATPVAETPTPTETASTAVPISTGTSLPCNQASFVSDVTIPDGTQIELNKAFTKTWKLKNVGTCTWTSGYALVFESGDQMGGPATQALVNGTVAPNQTVDISVSLVAPNTAGTYRGNWKIREPGGALFGLSTGPFWVEIKAVAQNQPPVSIPDWPIYKQGSQGPEVYAIQHLLRFHGQNLTPDGIFGVQTRTAVIAFQAAKGLSADGIVGLQTWGALINGVQLSEGSNGQAVRAAQTLLRDKYSYSITVDGAFGPNTESAVKDFQSAHSLNVDGIVGPNTWQALISY